MPMEARLTSPWRGGKSTIVGCRTPNPPTRIEANRLSPMPNRCLHTTLFSCNAPNQTAATIPMSPPSSITAVRPFRHEEAEFRLHSRHALVRAPLIEGVIDQHSHSGGIE